MAEPRARCGSGSTTRSDEAGDRKILGLLRHGPDRILHPLRRRSARARLARETLPTKILFVCQGNICRSAYAARAFADRLSPSDRALIDISSAGFVGPGRPPPSDALEVARSREVDLSEHRSRLVSIAIVTQARLLFTMDARQRRALIRTYGAPEDSTLVLGDLDPERIRRRVVADPYRRSRLVFERVFARIDRCLDELVRHLPLEAPGGRDGGVEGASASAGPH